MNPAGFDSLLRQKCSVRGLTFTGPEDFFDGPTLAYVEDTWDQRLGPLVPDLPSFETVMGGLRPAGCRTTSRSYTASAHPTLPAAIMRF